MFSILNDKSEKKSKKYVFIYNCYIIILEVRIMLVQFTYKNFKSYKEETTLDMTATSIKEHKYNVVENEKGNDLLKVAAIYGAIDAFDFMRTFIIESFKRQNEGKGIPVKRFAFDQEMRNAKAEFEVFFIYEGREYQYGFTVDNKRVHEEYLYKKNNRFKEKYDTLFERSFNKINCGPGFKEGEKFIELLGEATLFLSLISNTKIKDANKVFQWFLNTGVVDFGDVIIEGIVSRLLPISDLKDENYLKGLEEFMKAIDTGIEGIRVEEIKDTINEEDEPSYKVYSKHKMLDGNGFVEIPFSEESSRTQKMFSLYRFLIYTLREGNTLLIDELDAKIHPLLLRYIINMFHNPEINKNNAQLIYTTHDIYTLTKETFRRDQIWFTEKDKNGVSSLYSLAEYKLEDNKKVRNDATYNKEYLLGRYGAIPLLKKFNLVK